MLKGVDIGGTFIKVLWEDGRKEKHYIRDIKGNRERLLEKIGEVIAEGSPEGVGIAVAGFTSKEGRVFRSPNIPTLDGVDMREIADKSIKVAVGNDVTLGAYGEWFFSHKNAQILLLISVGTGLGGGLVVDGEPFFGVCGSAMEVGHHVINKGGSLCSCGRRGCWEAYCSSYGLEGIYRRMGGDRIKDHEIIKKAIEGDKTALRAVEEFKEYLYLGIMNMVHLFNPEVIVLGGGVIENMKPLLGDANERVGDLAEELPSSCLRIEFSSAGEFLSARGALAFIKTLRDRY